MTHPRSAHCAVKARALEGFETTLVKEPRRFRTEYGAGKAAKLSGNDALARKHYGRQSQIRDRADDPARPQQSGARARSASSRAR